MIKSVLNTKDPTVLRIADKYNLRPYFVAYLRSSMKYGPKTYDKQTLPVHIEEDNNRRIVLIKEICDRTDITPSHRNFKIWRLAREMKFRDDIVTFLKEVDDPTLNDILQ